jgi:hypothetical protein
MHVAGSDWEEASQECAHGGIPGGSHLINEQPRREYFYLRATLANSAIIMISASNCFSGCVS